MDDRPEEPSEVDKNYVKQFNAPVFIITPSGKIIKVPTNGPAALLSNEAPRACQ